MSQDFRERGRWLARNVLPHEALLRAKLGRMCLYDLDIEDVIQETFARFMTHPALDACRDPRQYAGLTARGIIIDHDRDSPHSLYIPADKASRTNHLNISQRGSKYA